MLCNERAITQELLALEKKFDSWSRLPAAAIESTRAIKKATTARHASSLPPAVAAFEVRDEAALIKRSLQLWLHHIIQYI